MHLFRKYISNRGSALFMVISTMTAIMMSCMAMYFSVVSSRSTQYAVFNRDQSKQSSISISDAILAGMMDGSNAQLKGLIDKIWALNVGETLTTKGNGFLDFDPAATGEADSNLGAYTVEITRSAENTFDIVVTSSVNGVKDVSHTIIDLEKTDGKDAPPAPTQVFAATGYVPNDVFLDGGKFITDVFFDNEQTIVNAYGGKNMSLWGDLATGGSLMCHAYLIPRDDRAQTFAIRNTYTANFNSAVSFAESPVEKSLVMIGGDAYFNAVNAGVGFDNANVYILGDLHTKGTLSSSANYFVRGNVIVEGGVHPSMKNVYCDGIVDATNNGGKSPNDVVSFNNGVGKTKKNWSEDGINEGFMTISEMVDLLDEKTRTNQYYKWIINDNDPSGDAYVPELDTGHHTDVHKTLHFTQNYTNPIPTLELKYGEDGTGCIIDDVTVDQGNYAYNNLALIIDTGEDEDNVYTIRVQANRDFLKADGTPGKDGVKETFSWYPLETQNSSTIMTVLVKGRGSVVVDVPPGVTYQDLSFLKFMHYGWYLLGGGSEETYTSSHPGTTPQTVYKLGNFDNAGSDAIFEKFIHKKCTAGDGCDYEESKSTNKCTLHDDTFMTTVKCGVHGKLNEFCEKCHPEKKGNHVGECANHVGRKEIETYLNAHPSIKSKMLDSNGEIIYPTTNIFLVSCDESANIRLSITATGDNIIQNSFFGYVYAPYMTFKAYGNNSGGGMVRLMGGMTVSDYIIDDSMSMIACWPEKMPQDLMSDDCLANQLQGVVNKGWKITLTGRH